MAYELHQDKHQLPIKAATDIVPRSPIKLAGTSGLLALPCATLADRPFGVTNAATYLNGEVVTTYFESNVMKLVANASVGVGTEVGVASSNGSVGPVTFIAASGHFAVGVTVSAAGAGEIVSVYINPRKA